MCVHMHVYSLSAYMSVCVCMHTCLHITAAAAAAVSGFHWAYSQLGVACGNKLKLAANWLNHKWRSAVVL